MELFEPFKKAVLAGIGMQEKMKEFAEELVKKGELSESQAAKMLKDLAAKSESSSTEFQNALHEIVAKTMEKMHIPTRDEVEALRKEVCDLTERLKKYEAAK